VEGVGEHGCEYMTGGRVVILGPVGKNFAAGMSGGIAYVLDEENRLYKNLNRQLVRMENLETKTEREELRRIIEKHVEYTGSLKGREILEHFSEYVPHFKKIIPEDYKEILKLIARSEEKGSDPETAKIEAFRAFVGGA
jgi:glutamate synthase (ferredoxin)